MQGGGHGLFQGRGHLVRAGVSALRIAGQVLEHRVAQTDGRRHGDGLVHLGWILADAHEDHGQRRLGHEGRLAGQGLVHHHREGVEIGAHVDLGAAGLLRAHILWCADDAAGGGDVLGLGGHGLGDAEVEHFDEVGLAVHLLQEDVVRFEVPMHQALAVGLGEGLEDLGGDAHQPLRRHRRLGREHVGQGPPGEKLHGEEEVAIRHLAKVEHPHRVGVFEHARGLGLAAEARDHIARALHVGAQDLDGQHVAGGGVLGLVYGAKAALADLLDDVVALADQLTNEGLFLAILLHDEGHLAVFGAGIFVGFETTLWADAFHVPHAGACRRKVMGPGGPRCTHRSSGNDGFAQAPGSAGRRSK